MKNTVSIEALGSNCGVITSCQGARETCRCRFVLSEISFFSDSADVAVVFQGCFIFLFSLFCFISLFSYKYEMLWQL